MGQVVGCKSFDLPRTATHRLFARARGFPEVLEPVAFAYSRVMLAVSRGREDGLLVGYSISYLLRHLPNLIRSSRRFSGSAVRFALLDKQSYVQVMSFSFSLLTYRCCIRFRHSYFLWRGHHGRARCCCFSAVPNSFQSWVCSATMLLGRLELFTLIAVFSPGF